MRTCLIIVVFLSTQLIGSAQQSAKPVVYSITEKDGLTDNAVNCFFQDSRGIMWMGTNYGLNSYDGSVITNYFAKKDNGLLSNVIYDISEDAGHRLWMGTGFGLVVFDPVKKIFTTYILHVKDSITVNRFYSVDVVGNTVLLATEKGLVSFDIDQGIFTIHVNEKAGEAANRITKIYTDKKNRTWVCTYNGLWQYDLRSGNFTSMYNAASEPGYNGFVTDVFEDHMEQIWFGTWTIGLKKLNSDNSVSSYLGYAGANTNLTTIVEQKNPDGSTSLWVSSSLSKLDEAGKKFISFYPDGPGSGQPAVCNRLYCDRNNLLWMATNRGVRIYNSAKQYFNTTILSDYVPLTSQGIALLPLDGKFLIGAEGGSALLLFDDSLRQQKNYASLINPPGAIMNIQRDKNGDFWICSSNGLLHFDSSLNRRAVFLHHDNDASSLPKNFLNTILLKKDGGRWVFPWRKGAWQMSADGKFSRIVTVSGDTLMPAANIAKVLEDRLGNIWFAEYTGGLFKYELATGKLINVVADRRLSNEYLLNDTIWTVSAREVFAVDVNTNQVSSFPLPSGRDKYEYDFIPDDRGCLWIATKTGLLAFNRGNQQFKIFSGEDGLFATDMDIAFAKLSNGNILLAGGTYATVFSPAIVQQNVLPATLLFTGATTDGKEKEFDGGVLNLQWNENNLSLNWALLNYSNPFGNQYFCKLDGVNSEWQTTGNHGQMNYNSLAPGKYSFHYRASSAEGVMSEEQTITIVVHPPFWRAAWFIIIAALLIAAFFFFIVRNISQRKLKERLLRLEKEQAVEKERNRISRDMHDELGSGLTRIAILSEVIKTQQSQNPADNIDRISETARGLVDNLDEMVWALNPKNDSLDKLIAYIAEYANQFLEGTGIECRISLPDQIIPGHISEEKRRNIFMAVKEFLNNTVKHSGAGSVSICLEQTQKYFELSLEDDGKGFDTNKTDNMGNGLGNIRQRIEDIGGTINISSSPNGTALSIKCDI